MRNMRNAAFAMTFMGLLLVAGLAVAQTPGQQQFQQQEETVTGTVVSAESQLLVIRADTGQLTFSMARDVQKPDRLQRGDRVRVHYRTVEVGNDGEVVRIERLGDERSTERETTQRTTERTERTERGERAMPRTASNLPMVGLLGLLSLAGAAGIGLVTRIF